jgi:hypothetical protein
MSKVPPSRFLSTNYGQCDDGTTTAIHYEELEEIEAVFALTLNGGSISAGDTIDFRLTDSGGNRMENYWYIPRITVQA